VCVRFVMNVSNLAKDTRTVQNIDLKVVLEHLLHAIEFHQWKI